MKICRIEGCEKDTSKGAQGMCGMHYLRWTRYGRLHTIVNRGSGWTITSAGYVLIQLENGNRQYEHILIAEKALGKKLPKGAIVHHWDCDGSNNKPSNLLICPDQSYHLLIHQRMKEFGYENY